MPYKELKKTFYTVSKEDFERIYMERFSSSEAVKLNFYIKGKQAFFLQNAEVFSLAYEIAKLDKKILILRNNLPGVAINQYSKKCLIDEIVLTNNIEGVHSSRKEIGDALDILEAQSAQKGKKDRFLGLVHKYLKLIQNEPLPLQTCQDIRNIYDEVFLEEIVSEDPANKPDGKIFRKEIASVYSPSQKVIHNGLYPEDRIIDAMNQALAFLHDDSIEELFRVCIFHYLIEYIHPFYDGNGRLGRFLFSYGLSQILIPLVGLRISGTIKKEISTYYKAFETCNDERNCGDLTPFLIMQLSGIQKAMNELEGSLLRRHADWEKYKSIVRMCFELDDPLYATFNFLIQAALFSENGITMNELKCASDYSGYKVKQLLARIPKDLLLVSKKRRFNHYSINLEKLDAMAGNHF